MTIARAVWWIAGTCQNSKPYGPEETSACHLPVKIDLLLLAKTFRRSRGCFQGELHRFHIKACLFIVRRKIQAEFFYIICCCGWSFFKVWENNPMISLRLWCHQRERSCLQRGDWTFIRERVCVWSWSLFDRWVRWSHRDGHVKLLQYGQ